MMSLYPSYYTGATLSCNSMTEHTESCNPTNKVVPFLVTKGSESGVSSLTEKAVSVSWPLASFEGTLQPGNGAAKQGHAHHVAMAPS